MLNWLGGRLYDLHKESEEQRRILTAVATYLAELKQSIDQLTNNLKKD